MSFWHAMQTNAPAAGRLTWSDSLSEGPQGVWPQRNPQAAFEWLMLHGVLQACMRRLKMFTTTRWLPAQQNAKRGRDVL